MPPLVRVSPFDAHRHAPAPGRDIAFLHPLMGDIRLGATAFRGRALFQTAARDVRRDRYARLPHLLLPALRTASPRAWIRRGAPRAKAAARTRAAAFHLPVHKAAYRLDAFFVAGGDFFLNYRSYLV